MCDIGEGSTDELGWNGVWDRERSHLRVMLRDVVVEVQVGLHPWERHPQRPTRLLANVEMFVPLPAGLAAEDEAGFVDYDPIRAALMTWKARPHTPLLETLLHELVGLCFANPRVAACRASLVKTDIFMEAGGAGVEAYVLRADHEKRL